MAEEKETGKFCSACSGKIVAYTELVYLGDPMSLIAGPGSRNQMTRKTTTYCASCGLLYRLEGGLSKPLRKRSASVKKPE